MIGSYGARSGPLCSLRAGTCHEPLFGAGFWLGVFLVALAVWGLHRGARTGGVYRWMFPNGDVAKSYGAFVVANIIVFVVGIALVVWPFVPR